MTRALLTFASADNQRAGPCVNDIAEFTLLPKVGVVGSKNLTKRELVGL